jgi:prevent-host-death family protein
MKQLSTREVRREFSKWIWHVRETGEPILITHYGRPFAVLGPPPDGVAVAVAQEGSDTL